jgi:ATP-dependent protease ClpP protease subunit
MDKKLKYIKGAVEAGKPADIYFYTDVDGWNADNFIYDFNYLIKSNVSKINIHINSCGGSIVDGISVFSRILDCKIPTACYDDGLAASMGSIIWAAGSEVYMKDYALLMIHNPFYDTTDPDNKYNQMTEAFKQQLSIIYQKRFNMDEDQVKALMDGEGDNDMTFLTASQAVERGFISQSHVIETPQAIRDKVAAVVKDGFDLAKIRNVMNSIAIIPTTDTPVGGQVDKVENKQDNKHLIQNQMNENEITVFAALLGIKNANVENVSAKITDLKAKAEMVDKLKNSLDSMTKERDTLKTELAGSKASVANLTADLKTANDKLKDYQDAEAKAQEQRIDALVDNAIALCKIDKADRETWREQAKNNFDLTKKVLDSIPGRKELSKEIAHDDNEKAKDALKTEEEKMEEKVNKVVGNKFKFHTFDEL